MGTAMRWLASLSASRAAAIALLWPATLVILPLVGFFWGVPLWLRHSPSRVSLDYAISMEPGSWPILIGMGLGFLLAPPLVFLALWRVARSR